MLRFMQAQRRIVCKAVINGSFGTLWLNDRAIQSSWHPKVYHTQRKLLAGEGRYQARAVYHQRIAEILLKE